MILITHIVIIALSWGLFYFAVPYYNNIEGMGFIERFSSGSQWIYFSLMLAAFWSRTFIGFLIRNGKSN